MSTRWKACGRARKSRTLERRYRKIGKWSIWTVKWNCLWRSMNCESSPITARSYRPWKNVSLSRFFRKCATKQPKLGPLCRQIFCKTTSVSAQNLQPRIAQMYSNLTTSVILVLSAQILAPPASTDNDFSNREHGYISRHSTIRIRYPTGSVFKRDCCRIIRNCHWSNAEHFDSICSHSPKQWTEEVQILD